MYGRKTIERSRLYSSRPELDPRPAGFLHLVPRPGNVKKPVARFHSLPLISCLSFFTPERGILQMNRGSGWKSYKYGHLISARWSDHRRPLRHRMCRTPPVGVSDLWWRANGIFTSCPPRCTINAGDETGPKLLANESQGSIGTTASGCAPNSDERFCCSMIARQSLTRSFARNWVEKKVSSSIDSSCTPLPK